MGMSDPVVMNPPVRILLLDNSPRRLAGRWFSRGFRDQAGVEVVISHMIGGRWVKSLDSFSGVIISGSPASATDEEPWIAHELNLIHEAVNRRLPLLGVCFGSQLLAFAFYGRDSIRRAERPEFGWHIVNRTRDDLLFENVPQSFNTFQYHMEEVVIQPGMEVLARNENSSIQAFRLGDMPVWGVQFHFEVTPQAGRDLLRRTQRVYQRFGLTYAEASRGASPNPTTQPILHNFIRTTRLFRGQGGSMG